MKFLYLALYLVLVTTSAMATPLSEEDAEKVLIVLQTEKHLQEMLVALEELNHRSFAERIGMGKPLTAEQQEAVETAVSTASQIIRTELAWRLIKPDLIRIIQKTFDGEELSSVWNKYTTSPGKELPEKLNLFEEKYQGYMLDRIHEIGPRFDIEIDSALRKLRKHQLDSTSEPLAHLKGEWAITTFLFGGGYSGISRCGLNHQSATIGSDAEGMIEVTAQCNDESKYVFKLVRGNDHRHYHLTVINTEGINVANFPLDYLGSQGWVGSAQQLVEDKEISLVAAITPIEGKAWYGWATWIRPAEEARIDYSKAKTPYLKVDFTRRK